MSRSPPQTALSEVDRGRSPSRVCRQIEASADFPVEIGRRNRAVRVRPLTLSLSPHAGLGQRRSISCVGRSQVISGTDKYSWPTTRIQKPSQKRAAREIYSFSHISNL